MMKSIASSAESNPLHSPTVSQGFGTAHLPADSKLNNFKVSWPKMFVFKHQALILIMSDS